jgi:hypothetical protein
MDNTASKSVTTLFTENSEKKKQRCQLTALLHNPVVLY